ncbi:MAG: cell division protein SepF [Armatimonadota bacterium]|nr:cell division protein SepF [Armatimonadota bacterium]
MKNDNDGQEASDTMHQQAEAEDYDNSRPKEGLFTRFSHMFRGHDDYEDQEEEVSEPQPQPQSAAPSARASGGSYNPLRRPPALRIDQARNTRITVRRAVQSFDDARRAADGLKDGQQQIVNLEQTPPEMAERIIDFLNGSTYALEGSVEKIGEQVYLFTPNSVLIEIEDKPATGVRAAIFDRD